MSDITKKDSLFAIIESIHDTVQIIGDSSYDLDDIDLQSLIVEMKTVDDKLDEICYTIEDHV